MVTTPSDRIKRKIISRKENFHSFVNAKACEVLMRKWGIQRTTPYDRPEGHTLVAPSAQTALWNYSMELSSQSSEDRSAEELYDKKYSSIKKSVQYIGQI